MNTGAGEPLVVGVVASMRPGGRTAAVVDAVLEAAHESGAEVESISLSGKDLAWADGTRAEAQRGDTRHLLERIRDAEAIVLGTPIYRATYTGALKNLLDLIPRGGYDGDYAALRAKPVGVVATGADDSHFLGTQGLVPILSGFFASYVVPPVVYAHRDQFDPLGQVSDAAVLLTLASLGKALTAFAQARREFPDLEAVAPQTESRASK
jgi:FMN reductase